VISPATISKAVQGREAQHSAAMRRAWSWQLEARTPDAATVSELAQLRTPGGVSDALRELKAAQRRLALSALPGAVAECERTAQAVLAESAKWRPHEAKHAQHEALISAVRSVVQPVVVKLASDELSEACKVSSACRRIRSHNTENCTRRAACVGTSAPAAPPAVVGQRHTTAQLCADQSGVAPPM